MISVDFEGIIKSALESGISLEDAATQFSNALNKVSKEKAVNPDGEARAQELFEQFSAGVKNPDFTLEDISAIIAYMLWNRNKTWGYDEVENTYEGFIKTVGLYEKTVGKEPREALSSIASEIMNELSEQIKKVIDQEEDEKETRETDRRCQCNGIITGEDVDEIIEAFLKSLR